MELPTREILEEFIDHQDPNPDTGCWLWNGAKQGPFGYGQFRTNAFGTRSAHRLSWIFHNGEIPAGLAVCHKCDVPLCINPDHLFLGTLADNMRDMYSKGRQNIQKKRTHCYKGHEYTPENTFKRHNGTQACKRCRSDAQLAYKGRNLEAVRKYQREHARAKRMA